ncbi:outer membrane beta-barrel protein [Gelatiniphilus marinus]|uniref:Outer membrane beta-barrel protein n=1 Tax=Gelatiniphilus marinus TaxID=1759464 RepID=A0ABW5JU96_9FLAO
MKQLTTLLMLFLATVLFAQDPAIANKLSVGGTVDAYYQTNLTSTDKANPIFNGGDGGAQSFGTSFANQTGFGLGMANIIVSYKGEKTGAVSDLAFGTRGLQAVGADTDVFINQLYAYWEVSKKTTLTLGRFNTYLGYEVISPSGNFNYSTSYLFSSGPFSHVGLKADFALTQDFSLMLAIMNPTDVNNDLVGGYAIGAQLGYAGHFLNFYYDDDEVLGFEVDYTGGIDVFDKFYLGINAGYSDNAGSGFYGVALYPQLATSDNFSIGLRGEYFNWKTDGALDEPHVFSITLTGSYTVENLIIKPELRLDSNSEKVYFDSDLMPVNSFAALTLAAIYMF